MKRLGILNSDIARVLAYMGHTDTLAIGDCGLPVPDTTERIDLAIEFGKPSFMDVLKPVSNDMKIEKIVLAEEICEQNPQRRNYSICKHHPAVRLYFRIEEKAVRLLINKRGQK